MSVFLQLKNMISAHLCKRLIELTSICTQRPMPVQTKRTSQAQPSSLNLLALHLQASIYFNLSTRQQLLNLSQPTPLLQPTFQPYAQQRTNLKQSYNLRLNTIGAEQTYTMNRFHDEVPDFFARGLLFGETEADARNLGHRASCACNEDKAVGGE